MPINWHSTVIRALPFLLKVIALQSSVHGFQLQVMDARGCTPGPVGESIFSQTSNRKIPISKIDLHQIVEKFQNEDFGLHYESNAKTDL